MEDLDNLRNLSQVIKDTALCGLGQTSPNPVLSTLEHFYDEILSLTSGITNVLPENVRRCYLSVSTRNYV